MDNLTHSLVGAVIGQTGLKRKTGLAMPTLIIAANLPDIDIGYLIYGQESIGLRRGLTHGPLAMLVLPVMLWAIMLWFDGWQTKRGKRPEKRLPIRKGWLLALAYIGCLSHPIFDWLNSYGVRLLEPFSSQWFYGDSIFIIDIWMMGAIAIGVWLSLRRERSGREDWSRPAQAAFLTVCTYIFANGVITGTAEAQATSKLLAHHSSGATIPAPLVVANPVPFQFWRREILWRNDGQYGNGRYNVLSGLDLDLSGTPTNMADPLVAKSAQADPAVRAFLFWSRMPIVKIEKLPSGAQKILTDQRFANPMVRGRFEMVLPDGAPDGVPE